MVVRRSELYRSIVARRKCKNVVCTQSIHDSLLRQLTTKPTLFFFPQFKPFFPPLICILFYFVCDSLFRNCVAMSDTCMVAIDGFYISLWGDVQQSVACSSIHHQTKTRSEGMLSRWVDEFQFYDRIHLASTLSNPDRFA